MRTGQSAVGRGMAGRRARAGFTLIEVMIVIAIILALTGLIGVALFSRRDEAKVNLVKTDLNNIKRAIDLFRLDFERFPTDEEGLEVLWNKEALSADDEGAEDKWKEYLESPMPTDKWGSEWGYRAESETVEGRYDLWSYGPDKEDGTEDDILLPGTESTDSRGEAPRERPRRR